MANCIHCHCREDEEHLKGCEALKQNTISEIPKPLGFDFRDKRSDKSQKAADWTPADALFDTNEEVKAYPCKQMLILWWEETPDGRRKFHWRNATSSSAEVSHLLVTALSSLN